MTSCVVLPLVDKFPVLVSVPGPLIVELLWTSMLPLFWDAAFNVNVFDKSRFSLLFRLLIVCVTITVRFRRR